ncbi:hypothetical protein [Terrihabitans rhizophilus]|uniref:Uncharacterized protein n=1 Tax=Terrihabitans rhizophilus TaxID=3092662 RepID=A0ABU4RLI5_9HYPH|nr:hypothetical protein [Terrihabitans sp. PJ23]MDX6805682.1 hypothetical protein [Terrihabitans sp. PJ23]
MAKNKIPKKIAGFKVPKTVRKSPVLKALLASDTGRQILGNALLAGASAAAAILANNNQDVIGDAGDTAARKTVKAGALTKDVVKGVTGAMAEVIGDAARAVVPALGNDDKDEKEEPKAAAAPTPVAQKSTTRTPRAGKSRPAHH